MATAEQPTTAPTPSDERPVTRSELREELAYALRNYVTRTELRQELSYALQHYSTKADAAETKADLIQRMGELEARLMRWMVAMMFGGMAAAAAIASFVALVLGN